MYKVFVGVDSRQPLAFNVLQSSIQRHTREVVAVIPLKLAGLPVKRRGLTDFTYSRFIVPHLCGYEGFSVFLDADQVVRADIKELFDCADPDVDIQVMQEQARFEWASVMLFNNARCKVLTPEFIDNPANGLLDMKWAQKVGTLPLEWNHCVGYAPTRMDAKLFHFTQGIPIWYEVAGLPEDDVWLEEYREMVKTVGWKDLMATSVHAKPTIQRLLTRLTNGAARLSDRQETAA